MRFSLVLGLLLLHASALCAQQHHLAKPADLPAWMAEQITGKAQKTSLKPNAKPVHRNAFIGTWIMRATGGKRILYWGDEHRMIFQEVKGMDEPVRTILVDLASNVQAVIDPGKERSSGRVRDFYLPQQGYFLELWSDSVVASGQRDTIMGKVCREYVGSNSNGGSISYWRTTVHPTLFADMLVWSPWLREGEMKYLSAFSDRRAGASLRVSWEGPQYTPTAGEMTFHRITPGKQPMPKLDLAGTVLAEERLLWVNATQLGRLPPWMRERLNRLPPDSLPLAYTPDAVDRQIPDNRFVGTLTAQEVSTYLDENGTTKQLATYSYWADARRAILTVYAPHEKGKTTYMVDLDHDVAIVTRNEGHSYVMPKLEITTLENAGLVEFGGGVDLPFTPTGTYRKILGRNCELKTTSERYLSHYWFSDLTTPNPIHDMARWMMPRPSQNFKDLMFFGVKDLPMPFAAMGTELTSFKPGKVPPPALDLSDHFIKDHRLDSHKRSSSSNSRGGSGTEGRRYEVTDSPMEERVAIDVQIVEMEEVARPSTGSGLGTSSPTADRQSPIAPFPHEVLQRTANIFVGKARLKFRLIEKRDTTEWIVDYAGTAEFAVLLRQSISDPNSARTALLIHRKAGDETRYTLDRATGKVSAAPPTKLRTEHAPEYITPMRVYTIGDETTDVLGRPCSLYIHETGRGRRFAWVDPKTPSIFLDLFSARKGWDGIEEYIQGKQLGLGIDGITLHVAGYDHGGMNIVMEVLSLERGPVDPNVFSITKDSWK